MKTKSQAAKIRELVAKNIPPKEIAGQLKVPISTVYTVRWKLKKANKVSDHIAAKSKAKTSAAKAKAKEIKQNNDILGYLLEELQATNQLISDAQAVETYLKVRIKEVFAARA